MMSSCSQCNRVLHWLLACLTAVVASPALAQSSLPTPWIAADVGGPSLTGSTTYGNDTFTVNGGGMGVAGRSDQFHFVYQQVTGDTMIVARIDGLTAADPESKVGLMFRESMSANAANAFAYLSGTNGLGLSTRTSTRARTTTTSAGTAQPTGWLALRRQGSTLTAYASGDGSRWNTLATSSVSMGQSVYVGIALSARSNTRRAQARVSSVSFAGGLPNGQQGVDIGSPSPAGSTSFVSNTYTMRAGGATIGGNSDQFHFVYQTLNGDVDLVAQVASVTAADAMSRAGVMVRASLSANAAFAYTSLRASAGYGFEWRYTSGASASVTNGGSGVAPGWVRLSRRGQRFDAYRSTDGQTWTLVDSEEMAMPTTVYVGLAATSARAGASTTATVSNFAVNTNLSNGAPTVTLTSPSAGQTWTAPASISIAATASDPEGRVSRVEFYANGNALGSDTSAPYGMTWSNVAAGSYAVTARVFDADGGQGQSASVSVTVTSPNSAPTVALTSPSLGQSFAVGTNVTLAANASDPEGRMSRVDFLVNDAVRGSDTSAPYSAAWSPTAAGTYRLAAVAYDADNLSTRSAEITVTVSAPVVTPPQNVVFTASSDHATTIVTSYRLNIYTAGANTSTATPIATSDLGKPTPDAQQTITVDRGSFFAALSPGSYIATVTAIGPGGSAQSQPPVSFTR